VIKKFSTIFVVSLQKVKAEGILCFMRPHGNFWNPSCAKPLIAYLACHNLARNLWKFTRKSWNCKAPSFSIIFCSTLWTTLSFTTDGPSLRSSSCTFVHPFFNILQHCHGVSSFIIFLS
jgi:hypothetical protein